jgi:WhiB family transcriptional regulator, redox-sensing transcriptional regulator
MGHAERIEDRSIIAAQASARYGARGVPTDWYVDPADPDAAERFSQDTAQSLDDQATAFLAAHEALAGAPVQESGLEAEDLADGGDLGNGGEVTSLHRERELEQRPDQAVWIGIPGIGQDFDDEGELGWQADALCAQTDPEAFFPEKGGSTRDAKKVCAACNVRSQCLEYALANDERFGIWGGLSERERRRLRKRAV